MVKQILYAGFQIRKEGEEMNELKHTPTPWDYCGETRDEPCQCGYIFGDEGRVYIAKTLKYETDSVDPVANDEFRKGNAQFIVKACNEYDALRSKLDKAREALKVYADEDNWDVDDDLFHIWNGKEEDPKDIARRALAELEKS